MGTGGTISGTGRYLKEKKPSIEVVGADPVGSILKQYKETKTIGEAHTYKIEGVGEDFIPSATDFDVVDRVISCGDREGLNMTRRMAREEALFAGSSSGMAMWVALEVARDLGPEALVVVLIPDTGERYLSKVHSDEWMRDNHMLDPSATRVDEVVAGKRRGMPRVLSVQAEEPLRAALAVIEQYDVNQVPVFRNGDVVGTLHDSEILRRALQDPGVLEKPAESMMEAALPTVAADAPMEQVARLLAGGTTAVLVKQDGKITGIVTRFDMIQFIAGGK
jgi:cystathionine beta-synthase